MSLTASTTISNQAEYLGRAAGLTAADRNARMSLSVVADSPLHIEQVTRY
jgi:hypothetical protein